MNKEQLTKALNKYDKETIIDYLSDLWEDSGKESLGYIFSSLERREYKKVLSDYNKKLDKAESEHDKASEKFRTASSIFYFDMTSKNLKKKEQAEAELKEATKIYDSILSKGTPQPKKKKALENLSMFEEV